METKTHPHTHAWVAGLASALVGLTLMHVFPAMKGISKIFALVSLFHLVGATLVIGATLAFGPQPLRRAVSRLLGRSHDPREFDFGWSSGWMNILWLMGLALAGVALGLQLSYPRYWPAWFLLALLAVTFFIGNGLLRASMRLDCANLPMVDLFSSDHGRLLDVGSGAGRTIIALRRVLKNQTVTAFDRFNADYIDGGGRNLLQRNLAIAGLSDRVQIESGDITRMPFPEASFDSAISTHVMDHLGRGKQQGLAEVYRVLKSGGRFLMVVWVPGWTSFAIGNVFSFLFTSKNQWRKMARAVGFEIQDEGMFNGYWFILLRK